MKPFATLLKVGSVTESMGVYVPTVTLQKVIGLARLLFLQYLMQHAVGQYNLMGLGMMIVTVAAPLLAMGANQGLVRYVAMHQARGTLREFYRRVALPACGIAAAMALLALALARPIAVLTIASKEQGWNVTGEQVDLCRLALLNALLLAVYNNVLAMMYGLRTYRLAAAMDMSFTVLFTAISCAVLVFYPTGLAALLSHLIALAAALLFGGALLHVSVRSMGISPMSSMGVPPMSSTGVSPVCDMGVPPMSSPFPSSSSEQQQQRHGQDAPGTHGQALGAPKRDAHATETARHGRDAHATPGALRQVLTFGIAALAGTLLWNSLGYVSYWLTNKHIQDQAWQFNAWMQLSQPVMMLSSAAWAVMFSHVVKRWEDKQPQAAMATLQTHYKLLGVLTMTLTVALYATAPAWSRLLPAPYREGVDLFGGLLMFAQMMSQLAIVTVMARLHEKPWTIAAAALSAGAVNAALALWLIPTRGAQGAAWAAGIGVYVGGGAAAALYMLLTRTRLQAGTWLLLAVPIILVAGAPLAAAVWAVLLILATATPIFFSPDEKRMLLDRLRRLRPPR